VSGVHAENNFIDHTRGRRRSRVNGPAAACAGIDARWRFSHLLPRRLLDIYIRSDADGLDHSLAHRLLPRIAAPWTLSPSQGASETQQSKGKGIKYD
jgi:hypothetical protein